MNATPLRLTDLDFHTAHAAPVKTVSSCRKCAPTNRIFALAAILLLTACAHAPAYEPADPFEGFNRKVYEFNRTADRYALRPIAVGYARVVPAPVRTGVSNFFANLTYPTVVVNDLLQARIIDSGRDLGRFVLNSTFGLAGFLDPATKVGLVRNEADFGQTLGRWGVGEGWFLMLPLLGPSTNRDAIGLVADYFTTPLAYIDAGGSSDELVLTGAQAVDARSHLLSVDQVLAQQIDPYVFVRTAYLQRREHVVGVASDDIP